MGDCLCAGVTEIADGAAGTEAAADGAGVGAWVS